MKSKLQTSKNKTQNCIKCGKPTRNTEEGEGQAMLCKKCHREEAIVIQKGVNYLNNKLKRAIAERNSRIYAIARDDADRLCEERIRAAQLSAIKAALVAASNEIYGSALYGSMKLADSIMALDPEAILDDMENDK